MNTTDPKERFYRQFQNSAESIQDQINQLPNFAAVGGVRQDAVEHILGAISRLSKEVADAIEFVPAYDQRGYFDKVKSLEIQVNQAAAKFTSSKSRFRFKKRPDSDNHTAARTDARRLDLTTNSNSYTDLAAKATSTETSTPVSSTKNYNAEIASLGPGGLGVGIRKPSFSEARDINLADHIRVHITLPASASRATSAGTLTNLHQCVVDMSLPTWTTSTTTTAVVTTGETDNEADNSSSKADVDACIGTPFASLTLKDIQDSAIVAGHVNGPVHVTGVRDSVVVVVARQVRIHECHNVVFYLHCVSRPIVEDCKGVRFAKAPGLFLTDKDKAEANLYDQVDDFKWLKTFSSPNWSLLPESEIIPDAVWKTALAGEPDVIIDTTLRSLGVKKGLEAELKN
ncbi:hypothetical protein CHGG_09633 [Chaetomium globosum CBS 148.51]|uniref:C-CAP/cofactor C-like domain-containing protein n=1 Tax=Chaetomium globosum (strain ATCC 6205 / CBS 148.51 / DSM 1962 / NBRC 6347 / NRRL 1970) TaxID=306901 RepID=Q2GQX1_CHAGB|nr:uncharacterized protein CHGG_09633 [Chaetomium globosum CBS 148.51]EAQ83229.1 hypothetical protein CHGG_09633 [Chaetomium globosum CBS 148.51]